jgi:hypothetical protein
MKLEEQVVSLDLAKKLKELGVTQDSYCYWYGGNLLRGNQLTQELRRHEPPVSAYTVAELGEMLPNNLMYGEDQELWFDTRKNNSGNWMVCYSDDEEALVEHADTEADARAKMLIYLIEQRLIEL